MQHLTFGNRKLEFCFERVADSRARQTSICIRGGLLAGWAAAFARMLALAEWAPNVRQTAVLTLCAATMLILAFGAAYLQWFVDARGSAEGTKCYLMVACVGTSMAAMMMCQPGEMPFASPLSISCLLSWYLLMDGLRLVNMLKMLLIMTEGFFFAEVHHYLQQGSMRAVAQDMVNCLIFAVFVPVVWALWRETRARMQFVQSSKQPWSALGPFWTACVRKMPFYKASLLQS